MGEFEKRIAECWNDGVYTEQQAKRSTEIQSLRWDKVVEHKGRLYEQEQRDGAESWN